MRASAVGAAALLATLGPAMGQLPPVVTSVRGASGFDRGRTNSVKCGDVARWPPGSGSSVFGVDIV